jgi:thiamine-phosphate diphosphorylase
MGSRADAAAVPVVHAVTTDALLLDPAFPAAAARVLRALGPRGAVHLRSGALSARQLLALAERLVPEARQSGALLVINDRLDVALAAGTSAVQLTSGSIAVADARGLAARLAPGLWLGASVHDPAAARRASEDGADWVVAGHVFATASHPGEPGRGVELVRACVAAGPLPVIAIGGVRPRDVAGLRRAGAAGVAAIRGIWGAALAGSDAEDAATDYLTAYDADAYTDAGGDAAGE